MSTLFDREIDVQLIKYLPDFIQVYKEVQAIMNVEKPEIEDLWKEYKRAFKNNFIRYADSTGIGLFEKMMNIIPGAKDDLETRKNRVLIKWNSQPPYTWRFLINFLNSLLGEGQSIPTRDLNIHELRIVSHVNVKGTIAEVYKTLRALIPANLTLIFDNKLFQESEEVLNLGTGIIVTIRNEVR